MARAFVYVPGWNDAPIRLRLYWLHEPFAVTREEASDDYRVTHVPTGWGILGNFDSRAHAIRFARLLRTSFDWRTVTRYGWEEVLTSEDRQAIGVAICAAKWATSSVSRAEEG